MSKNMFDLDDELLEDDNYSEELNRADALCMREQFDRALEIYNKILDNDLHNEGALLGVLKVHSKYYSIYDGPEIEKDIRIIERILPNINNSEYLDYCKKRIQNRKNLEQQANNKNNEYIQKFKNGTELFKNNKYIESILYFNDIINGYNNNLFDKDIVSKAFNYNDILVASLFKVGYSYYRCNDMGKAKDYFEKARVIANQKDFDYYAIYFFLGDIYYAEKNYPFAIEFLKVGLQVDFYSRNYYKLAHAYVETNQYAYAKEAFEKYLFNPKNENDNNIGWAWYSYALLFYYGRGVPEDKTKAKECFGKAYKHGYEQAKKWA